MSVNFQHILLKPTDEDALLGRLKVVGMHTDVALESGWASVFLQPDFLRSTESLLRFARWVGDDKPVLAIDLASGFHLRLWLIQNGEVTWSYASPGPHAEGDAVMLTEVFGGNSEGLSRSLMAPQGRSRAMRELRQWSAIMEALGLPSGMNDRTEPVSSRTEFPANADTGTVRTMMVDFLKRGVTVKLPGWKLVPGELNQDGIAATCTTVYGGENCVLNPVLGNLFERLEAANDSEIFIDELKMHAVVSVRSGFSGGMAGDPTRGFTVPEKRSYTIRFAI